MVILFPGRFQPFHKGHRALMEVELNKDNFVVIALRDTKISKENPHTIKRRKKMINKKMKRWRGQYKIITIPDFEKIIHGRNVGYKIEKIKLDSKVESISATKIRNK